MKALQTASSGCAAQRRKNRLPRIFKRVTLAAAVFSLLIPRNRRHCAGGLPVSVIAPL
ncbi:hypothetical protein COH91_01165 [Neisseria meningitidis]|nr:hypothetical protein COH91_01165 [Neisseria meningitidis]RQK57673.1 hypothetical protein COH64_02560 [Neisseria meningitidis]